MGAIDHRAPFPAAGWQLPKQKRPKALLFLVPDRRIQRHSEGAYFGGNVAVVLWVTVLTGIDLPAAAHTHSTIAGGVEPACKLPNTDELPEYGVNTNVFAPASVTAGA